MYEIKILTMKEHNKLNHLICQLFIYRMTTVCLIGIKSRKGLENCHKKTIENNTGKEWKLNFIMFIFLLNVLQLTVGYKSICFQLFKT